nr:ribonuclease H-like domain-containing protein [Tanacetum cinerariifolium]
MAFSSSSSSSDNGVPSCSKACLESVEARLVVYKQNESILEENIQLLKVEVQVRYTTLTTLRQKLDTTEKERDDLNMKLEKFQTSSKRLTDLLASQTSEKAEIGYNSQVFTKAMFDCDSSESDSDSWSPSNLHDRFVPSGGYHAVPPLITETFMPPKPDLVFHTPPSDENEHLAFNVQLSPTKPEQDLSSRPGAPIIEDWVSDSEDESETTASQIAPSFVQSTEQVKLPRHSVQPVETSIPAATPKPISPKSNRSSKRKNIKTCFVCKSLDHLIKDYDYHAKKKAQPTTRNYAHRGTHKQNASFTHHPQMHMVLVAVLSQSKPISTVVRPICAAVSKIMATKPRHARSLHTNTNSIFRRHITRGQSPKISNSHPRVTTAQALVVSAAKGLESVEARLLFYKQNESVLEENIKLLHIEVQGNPQQDLKDQGVIDSGCSRHMTGNMSYFSDFEELNGGYVAFGGNLKGGKITAK